MNGMNAVWYVFILCLNMISELVDLMIYLIISRVLLDFETVFQLYTDREKQRGRDRQREIEREKERDRGKDALTDRR